MPPYRNVQKLLKECVLGGPLSDLPRLQESLQNVPVEQRLEVILAVRINRGETVIHRAGVCGYTSILRCVLDKLSPEERYMLIMTRDREGGTGFHYSVLECHLEASQYLLDLLTSEQQRELMKIVSNDDATPLYFAVIKERNLPTIKLMLELFTEEDRFEQMTQFADRHLQLSPLLYASHHGATDILKLLLGSLSPAFRIRAIDHLLAHDSGMRHDEMKSVIQHYKSAAESSVQCQETTTSSTQSQSKGRESAENQEEDCGPPQEGRRSKRLASKGIQTQAGPSTKKKR